MAEQSRDGRDRRYVALIVIAVVCASLLAATSKLTEKLIEANQHRYQLNQIVDLAGSAPLSSTGWVDDIWNLCTGTTLARHQTAGYGGTVSMLMAITVADASAPRLRGVRVIRHQETPGIADFLHQPDRGWLASLAGKDAAGLAHVDAVTGATISSKAVVNGALAGFEAVANAPPECAP